MTVALQILLPISGGALIDMHADHSRPPSPSARDPRLWSSMDHMDLFYGTVLRYASVQPPLSRPPLEQPEQKPAVLNLPGTAHSTL